MRKIITLLLVLSGLSACSAPPPKVPIGSKVDIGFYKYYVVNTKKYKKIIYLSKMGNTESDMGMEIISQDYTNTRIRMTVGGMSNETTVPSITFTGMSGLKLNNNDFSETNDKDLTNFVYQGMEKVTVPVGTFDAAKLTSETVMNFPGNKMKSTYTVWLVKDLGEVKKEITTDMGGRQNPGIDLELKEIQ